MSFLDRVGVDLSLGDTRYVALKALIRITRERRLCLRGGVGRSTSARGLITAQRLDLKRPNRELQKSVLTNYIGSSSSVVFLTCAPRRVALPLLGVVLLIGKSLSKKGLTFLFRLCTLIWRSSGSLFSRCSKNIYITSVVLFG